MILQLYVLLQDAVVVHSEFREKVLFSGIGLALGFGVSDPGGRREDLLFDDFVEVFFELVFFLLIIDGMLVVS